MSAVNTANHAQLAQFAAEQWLEQLWSAEADEQALPEGADRYCGCTTCLVREVLNAATPELWICFLEILESHGVKAPDHLRTIFLD